MHRFLSIKVGGGGLHFDQSGLLFKHKIDLTFLSSDFLRTKAASYNVLYWEFTSRPRVLGLSFPFLLPKKHLPSKWLNRDLRRTEDSIRTWDYLLNYQMPFNNSRANVNNCNALGKGKRCRIQSPLENIKQIYPGIFITDHCNLKSSVKKWELQRFHSFSTRASSVCP